MIETDENWGEDESVIHTEIYKSTKTPDGRWFVETTCGIDFQIYPEFATFVPWSGAKVVLYLNELFGKRNLHGTEIEDKLSFYKTKEQVVGERTN